MKLRNTLVLAIAALAFNPLASYGKEIEILPEEQLYIPKENMEAWNDLRFGMFIHWGPWSQREVGYIWKMVNEENKEVGSKSFDLWETFNPTKFDPKKWAKAAKDAGMTYVVFVTKHHDGVNNFDTKQSEFKTTNSIVPYHKNKNADLTKAIVEAFRAEGLAIGLYYSHIDWHHEDGKYFSRDHWDFDPSRVDSDRESWERFATFQKNQVRELLTNYGKIDILWYDIHWPFGHTGNKPTDHPVVREDILELISMMRTLQPDMVFNDRGTDKFGGFYTPEQNVPATGLPGYWESNITITNERGFWYKGDHVSAKSPDDLIRMLVEISAKGGNFLMNVGPRPDGQLSKTEIDALSGIGDWMEANSESIHATDKSLFIDLPWGWSTTTKDKLYLHVFDWPKDGNLIVPGLLSGIRKAYLLEDSKEKALKVSAIEDGKSIQVGKKAPHKVNSVVVLEINGKPEVHNTYRQIDSDPIKLAASIATINSSKASYNYGTATRIGNFVQDISSTSDKIIWDFQLNTPGEYTVIIEYATQPHQAGSKFNLSLDGIASFNATVRPTEDWKGDILQVFSNNYDPNNPHAAAERHSNLWLFKKHVLGTINVTETGAYTITLSPDSIAKDYLAFVKSVILEPLSK